VPNLVRGSDRAALKIDTAKKRERPFCEEKTGAQLLSFFGYEHHRSTHPPKRGKRNNGGGENRRGVQRLRKEPNHPISLLLKYVRGGVWGLKVEGGNLIESAAFEERGGELTIPQGNSIYPSARVGNGGLLFLLYRKGPLYVGEEALSVGKGGL